MNLYAMKYRPAGFATCPNGWTLVERGTIGCYPLRTDLPLGATRFGVIGYEHPLSQQDIESYELEPLGKGGEA